MTGDRAVEALDALRAEPVAPPTPTFADALERQLRDEHPGRGDATPRRDPAPRRRRWPAAAVAAAAALVIGLALGALPDGADGRVVMTAARDTSVVLPNGQVVHATAGLELADGTIIVTGEEGAAEVDGVAIGSSRVAVIVGDDVVVLDPFRAPRPAPDPPATTTTRGPDAPTTAPPPTRPPTETTTTDARPATTTTSTAARPSIGELTVAAERVSRTAVAVRWSAYTGPSFDRYVVVRTLGDGGSPTTVFASRSASTVAFRDELPAGATSAAYRVLALDRTGEVIAASPITRV